MIYVDEIRHYPLCKLPYKYWCHMVTDSTNLEELHVFAESIGLQRRWFQKHPTLPHYDLVPSKRTLAIRKGAKAIPSTELAMINHQSHKPLGSPNSLKE